MKGGVGGGGGGQGAGGGVKKSFPQKAQPI